MSARVRRASLPCLLTNNERDHGGSVSAGGFKTLDQLLDLPHLNIRIVLCVGFILVRHDGNVVVEI